MENILLWVSVLLGLLVFVSAVLTRRELVGTPETPPDEPLLAPALRNTALALPPLGMLLSLSTFAPFSSGQGLGLGFLIGGVASILAALPLLRGRRMSGADLMAGPYGIAVTALALVVLFLRGGLLDTLFGVALGWFSVAFTLYLGLSATARRESGMALAAGTGFAVALSAGTVVGALRSPGAGSLSHLAWDAAFLAFAAVGATLLYAASFLPRRATLGLPLAPLTIVVLGGAVGAYLLADKVIAAPHFWQVALGGLLLSPVAALVLQNANRRARLLDTTLPPGGLPLLAVLLALSGFLVAFQMLQAFGASVVTLALFLAFPASLSSVPAEETEVSAEEPGMGMVSLLLFTTGLLLYRVFVARWTGELRGVTLTDQYALFGLIVGAALPALLSSVPLRRTQNTGMAGLLTLAVSGVLALLAPASVILLFGPKCALALLIGLALGAAQRFVGERNTTGGSTPTYFPFLFALAISLALCQWGGQMIPAVADLTRATKVAWLAGLFAVLAVLLFASDRVQAAGEREVRKGVAQ